MILDQLPRLLFAAFSVYCLVVLVTRWRFTRVLTRDRRFLFLFIAGHCLNVILSATLKITAGIPADYATWTTVLVQSFLAAYLHYSIPRDFRSRARRRRRRR